MCWYSNVYNSINLVTITLLHNVAAIGIVFCHAGSYVLIVSEVTDPPFLGTRVPDLFVQVKVVSQKATKEVSLDKLLRRSKSKMQQRKWSNYYFQQVIYTNTEPFSIVTAVLRHELCDRSDETLTSDNINMITA